MCTLDDKLLGEKVHNYCSSSEGEDNDDDEGKGGGGGGGGEVENGGTVSLPPPVPPQGRKYNTGPKGVLEDYKHFKEMEAQKRREKQENDRKIAKK